MEKREAKFVIMGKPVAWARPGKTKYSHASYDTQKELKEDYKWRFKFDFGSQPLFEGPLHAEFKFFMPITGSYDKRKKERDGEPHIFAPDVDNLAKFCLDAATGILYADDKIIASISAIKIWDQTPRTEMIIREL